MIPFTPAYLEVDPPLWGSFWQGDVISPGYTLPALELAYLRATRLDQNWSSAILPDQFLASLQDALTQPDEVQTMRLADHQLICYRQAERVVWFSPQTEALHAGYHRGGQTDWLAQTARHTACTSLAEQIDDIILQHRREIA